MTPATTAEAWIEQHATHTCPHWGGKFNPAQCGGRKTKAKRIAERHSPGWDWVQNSAGYDLSKCLECDGPIPIQEGTEMVRQKEISEVSEFPIPAAKQESVGSCDQLGNEYRCRKCGKVGPDGFYLSVRNYCKGCRRQMDKERHAARPKKYALIVTDGEVACPQCGKAHTGFLVNGRAKTNICKECVVAKRNQTWHKSHAENKHKRNCYAKGAEVGVDTERPVDRQVVIDFDNYPEILECLLDASRSEFRSIEHQVLWILSRWAKDREGGGGGGS